ncbi:inorganic diphosphatase [Cochleicola gelatinilyticus]|uniref:inorganic diphosphatase n=1 Tax=Cochleicola gelatinilyticus TaxID=1763537 RepID=A0A167IL64_9FLAO|nr:inorganic diphosphatase [Cochleicola gelatinilyticus]OAB79779.1 hypothetical protein ULVI_03270 [Cochleicola gelatinilyticus]
MKATLNISSETNNKKHFSETTFMKQFLFSISVLILFSCCSSSEKYTVLTTLSEADTVTCVIEIPAGTNKKIEQNKQTYRFEIDQRDGKDRVIQFLPYPGNYGYIAGTYSDPEKGGDGDALDVLVIAETLPSGTILQTIPLGVLKLIDDGEEDYKILAIPSDPALQTVTAKTFSEFKSNYPQAVEIIQLWFLNYDTEPIKVLGWGDEIEALSEIKKTIVVI